MTLVACFLTFSGAVLREIGKRSMLRPWHAILLVCTVTVLAAGVADPIALALAKAAHKGLGSITVPFWAGVDWLTALSRLWSLSMPTVLIIVSMTTLVMLYIDKTTRAAQALAALQLRLADTQRRALAEQLQTAQAMVDPAFMFGTLALIEQRFEPEPALAQRLLDALIRYLRAAIPGPSEVVGTLGQQAELVRAYLDIECVRSTGRLQARVEVPASLEQRAFAPSLVLPLVAHAIAIGDDDRPSHIGWVEVSAWLDGGHLIVQVDDDRSGEGSRRETAALTDLRRRLAALYGNGASLTLDDRQPRGTRARIVIDDPGETT